MKVLTVGTFDLYHVGHALLFQKCAKLAQGGQVVVGVNTDKFVKKFKGKEPIMNEYCRWALVTKNCDVNEAIYNNDSSLKKMIKKVKPDVLVIGSDWAKKDYYKQIGVTAEWLYKQRVLLTYVPYTEGISTTEIKKKICSQK